MSSWTQTWSPLPKRASEPTEKYKLLDVEITDKEIEEFWDRGYIRGPKVISDEHLVKLRDEFDRIMRGEMDKDAGPTPYEYEFWRKVVDKHQNNSPDVRKVNNSWWINTTVRDIIKQPSIGGAAAKLLKTKQTRLWHDQAIWKPSLHEGNDPLSGNIGWHQDYAFWQMASTPDMITAWIPLQDVDLTNGCMRTIVGSHKWGLIPDSATFFDKDLEGLRERFSNQKEWLDEPCIMPAGHVVFHHALTIHGSGANTRGAPRLALALHMMPKDCAYVSEKGWHHNLRDLGPNTRDGDLYVGDAFPVMYDEEQDLDRKSNF
jgi:ectoine hydroxylase-related dioxygenase (phytanoyl-CoA dioxygenase family)